MNLQGLWKRNNFSFHDSCIVEIVRIYSLQQNILKWLDFCPHINDYGQLNSRNVCRATFHLTNSRRCATPSLMHHQALAVTWLTFNISALLNLHLNPIRTHHGSYHVRLTRLALCCALFPLFSCISTHCCKVKVASFWRTIGKFGTWQSLIPSPVFDQRSLCLPIPRWGQKSQPSSTTLHTASQHEVQ